MNKISKLSFIIMNSPKKSIIKLKTLSNITKNVNNTDIKKNIDMNDSDFSNNFWEQSKIK